MTDSAILRTLIDSSELILAAQLEIADAIGKVATSKTMTEVAS